MRDDDVAGQVAVKRGEAETACMSLSVRPPPGARTPEPCGFSVGYPRGFERLFLRRERHGYQGADRGSQVSVR